MKLCGFYLMDRFLLVMQIGTPFRFLSVSSTELKSMILPLLLQKPLFGLLKAR